MMDLTQKQWVKHSVFHPFEGFEDLRWKKGGSVLYASIVILLWFVAKILHDNLVGYQFAVTNTKMFSIVPYIVQTIAVFLVFVIGNWSICTLLDGEGTIKKIYIYSAYSMIPYVAGLYIRTLLSHVLIQDEVIFITCVTVISTAWSVLLMFNAIKAVHQYSISKTILALLLTFVAMLIILILLVLLVALFQQVYVFVSSVYTEITYRVRVKKGRWNQYEELEKMGCRHLCSEPLHDGSFPAGGGGGRGRHCPHFRHLGGDAGGRRYSRCRYGRRHRRRRSDPFRIAGGNCDYGGTGHPVHAEEEFLRRHHFLLPSGGL